MNTILAGIPVIFVFLICVYKIQSDKSISIEKIQQNMNALRGLFAIVILIGHTTMNFQYLPLLLLPFSKINTLCVGFFFVMSGYGLAYSAHYKEGYTHEFLTSKIIFLALHAGTVFVCALLFSGIQMAVYGTSLWNTGINWYLFAQALFYIIFYIMHRIFKTEKAVCIGVWVGVIVFTLVCMMLRVSRVYYISEWCFPLGITVFMKRKQISEMLKKHYILCCGTVLVTLIISISSFIVEDYTILDIVTHNLLCVGFYAAIFMLLTRVRIDNAILRYLNSISMELYLYQFVILAFLSNQYEVKGVTYFAGHFILVVVLDIALASAVRLITKNYQTLSKVISGRVQPHIN